MYVLNHCRGVAIALSPITVPLSLSRSLECARFSLRLLSNDFLSAARSLPKNLIYAMQSRPDMCLCVCIVCIFDPESRESNPARRDSTCLSSDSDSRVSRVIYSVPVCSVCRSLRLCLSDCLERARDKQTDRGEREREKDFCSCLGKHSAANIRQTATCTAGKPSIHLH